MVKGPLELWVEKYWQDGRIFVFLLNNGCWQVAFKEQKAFRIYAIDQYGISWAGDPSSSEMLYRVRQIVRKYKQQYERATADSSKESRSVC